MTTDREACAESDAVDAGDRPDWLAPEVQDAG
jgi:hypothetical protein